jgi:hypothetical protein
MTLKRITDPPVGTDELASDETLTIEADEFLVAGGSYSINGDATITGDLVVVSNSSSHDNLNDIDPTDHLEIIKEFQITATSGATPAFDGALTTGFGEQTTAFDVTVAPTSGINDTYAFNFDAGRKYNNGSWDVPLTINFDIDPEQDLGLTVIIHRRT